ncbi:unnamed protein product [Cylicocyclus nassatus]|uniref:Retrotransposon gag domain-containing protein n=1 Tax=Cylicocyclus nassatus TaxID=53992 RepID=A0AA36HA37_CYLNA|nr:unnamed protein product [Cylicocyclus nassatus]
MTSPEVSVLTQTYGGLTLGKLAPKHIDYFLDDNTQDFNKWHRQFEDLIRNSIVPLPEQCKVNALYASLREDARDIIEEMPPEDKNSYEKVVAFLRTHFEYPQFRALARQELSNCRQKEDEDVHSFSNRIRRAVQKLLKGAPKEMVQDRLLEEFVERLRPELKFHIKSLDPATFDEALRKARTYESLCNQMADVMVYHPVKKEESHHPTTTGLEML